MNSSSAYLARTRNGGLLPILTRSPTQFTRSDATKARANCGLNDVYGCWAVPGQHLASHLIDAEMRSLFLFFSFLVGQ